MFQSLRRKLLSAPSTPKNVYLLLQTHHPKFFSTSTNQPSPTTSYLVDKFGLPLDSAIQASQKFTIRSTERSDSVLQVLKSYGFSQTHMVGLITMRPGVLLADPVKIITPKLEFLRSLGYSNEDIVHFVRSNKPFLFRSLKNHIVPVFSFLRKYLDIKEILAVLVGVKCGYMHLGCSLMESNVQVLRDRGVPDDNIRKLFRLNPAAIARKNDRFVDIVRMVEGMEFEPQKRAYVNAISVIGAMAKSRWQKKVHAYKSYGWSDDDFAYAFRLQQNCMLTSEEKIGTLMDFYLNELGLEPADLAKCPNAMLVSLKKRLIPRCSVLQVLLSHGLIKKDIKVLMLLVKGNAIFEKAYVRKHQDMVPDVLKAYKGELGYPRFEVLRNFFNQIHK